MSVDIVVSARLMSYSISGVSYYLDSSSISSEVESLKKPLDFGGAIAIALGLESA